MDKILVYDPINEEYPGFSHDILGADSVEDGKVKRTRRRKMKPFDPKSICIMCHSSNAGVKYIVEEWDPELLWNEKCEPHLRRTCDTCGYIWKEKTLEDSKLCM